MPEADRTRLVPERGANDVLRVEATGEAVTLRTGHISSPDEVACLPWHRDHVRREEFRDCVMPEAYDVMPRQGSMSAEVRVRFVGERPAVGMIRKHGESRVELALDFGKLGDEYVCVPGRDGVERANSRSMKPAGVGAAARLRSRRTRPSHPDTAGRVVVRAHQRSSGS